MTFNIDSARRNAQSFPTQRSYKLLRACDEIERLQRLLENQPTLSNHEWEAVCDAIYDRIERLEDVQRDPAYSPEDRARAEYARHLLETVTTRLYNKA